MEGYTVRITESLRKIKSTPWVLSGVFLCASCATPGAERGSTHHDAHGKIQASAQADWERSGKADGAEYHFLLGQAYAQDGKVDRAIEEYRAALIHDPESALIHSKLAAEYLKKGSVSFAIEECERALKIDPGFVDVRLMLGGIHALNHDLGRALVEYEKVLKYDPLNDEAAVFKTQVLAELERFKEALSFIRAFTRKVPDSAAAWFYAGKLEQVEGHPEAALRAYRKALEIRPGFSQATLAIGLLFETRGDNRKAIEIYEAQVEERFESQVAGRLVSLYLRSNLPGPALKLLQSMVAVDPEDLNARLRLGLLHMQRENWSDAKAVLSTLVAKVPDSDKVHYYLSAVHEQEGSLEVAINHLLKVSSESKLFEDSRLHAAGLWRRMGKRDQAHEVLSEGVKLSPENPGLYVAQASMFEDEKRLQEADRALQAGLKLFPDHEKMRYFRGALLEKQGKMDEAVVEMQRLLKINADHADALNFVAYTWTTQGVRLKDAENMLRRAIRLKPDNPYILDSLGWNQFMLGKPKDALIYLEKAALLKGDEETILEHLVEVYSRNQMPERARALKARIVDLQARTDRAPASVEEK
jgi:tetratricopeptide (TPR) repeat protein